MFQCHVCGHGSARAEVVSEVLNLGDRHVLVERIPAKVCERCGEPEFSRETTEQIRRLVHGPSQPARTETLDVFAMA
jgi:HTH-type transcriptional regulator / antitoxin MqsA